MRGDQTVYIDLARLGQAGDDAATVLRLIMAAGDVQIANQCMGKCEPGKSIFNSTLREAATLYFVRLQCGHINEAMDAIKEIEQSTYLRSLVSRLAPYDQHAYQRLLDCIKGRPGYRDFQDNIGTVRQNVAFHYSKGAVEKALNRLTNVRAHRLSKMTRGSDISRCRFHIADLILKVTTNRVLWRLDPKGDAEQQLKEPLGYGSDLCEDLLLFAGDFAWEYLKAYTAI
ncbi:MAG TPA: hypothetical protein VMX94_06250 [Armatimonadota bacterium]|nr:hypothetical protein [Armatimonadota bacterium]